MITLIICQSFVESKKEINDIKKYYKYSIYAAKAELIEIAKANAHNIKPNIFFIVF